MPKTMPQLWTVWLDMEKKIASFHEVDGFTRQDFRDHGYFLHYMQELQSRGYLFQ